MIEIAHIGTPRRHAAFRAAAGQPRLDPRGADRLLAFWSRFSLSMWGEHCTECAAPDCHRTCDLFRRGGTGRCVRFEAGIAAVPTRGEAFGFVLEAVVRPWGQFIAVGNRRCFRRRTYGRRWRLLVRAGRVWLGLQHATAWLPARVQWHVTDKLRGLGNKLPALLNRAARRAAEPLPDALLAVLGNPGDAPMAIEIAVSGFGRSQGGRGVRRTFTLAPGWNELVIPVAELAGVIDLDGLYRISLVPLLESPALLEIAFAGFASRGAPGAGTAAPPAGGEGKVKLLVCDLDNTLWDGVLVEGRPERLALKSGVREVLEELDRRGILLSIASKNNAADALAVLRRLGLADLFLRPRIDWNPKSANLAAIVRDLNIGADAVAFVDDQAFERAEVASALPAVRTYGADELCALPARSEFDVPVTEESRRRRALYREEQTRLAAQAEAALDYVAFLRSCRLRLELLPLRDANRERVYELVQRTNQLNYSGRHYTRGELDALVARPATRAVVMRCRDRFGEYGIIGFALAEHVAGGALRLTDMMLSCRVQGKRVEHGFLRELARAARDAGGKRLECRCRRTARNAPARRVFEEMAFVRETEEGADGERWTIGVPEALAFESVVEVADPDGVLDFGRAPGPGGDGGA